MIRWLPYTFIRIVLCFASGIVAGIYQPAIIPQPIAILLLVTLVAAYLVSFFLFRARNRSLFNLGFVGLPAIILAGYVHTTLQTGSARPDHLSSVAEPIRYYKAVITQNPEEKQRSWKAEANVTEVFTGTWQRKNGKVILYFSNADLEPSHGTAVDCGPPRPPQPCEGGWTPPAMATCCSSKASRNPFRPLATPVNSTTNNSWLFAMSITSTSCDHQK